MCVCVYVCMRVYVRVFVYVCDSSRNCLAHFGNEHITFAGFNPVGGTRNQCISCGIGCAARACNTVTGCSACNAGYSLFSGVCSDCTFGCTQCLPGYRYNATTSTCVRCISGEEFTPLLGRYPACFPCGDACFECSSEMGCFYCRGGYVPVNGTCTACPAGTSASLSRRSVEEFEIYGESIVNRRGLDECVACREGTFSGPGSSFCQPWRVCNASYYAANVPTATSDRICIQVDACVDYPCSFFSIGSCIDLPPPAINNALGRTCGGCIPGYLEYNGTCVNALVVPPVCFCPAEGAWFITACGASDSRLCTNGYRAQTRRCGLTGTWEDPSSANCIRGLWRSFYYDR